MNNIAHLSFHGAPLMIVAGPKDKAALHEAIEILLKASRERGYIQEGAEQQIPHRRQIGRKSLP